MPTDALVRLRDVMAETRAYGFEKVRQEQMDLGAKVRALLESRGFPSVAADGFKAPGVVVSYTSDPAIQSGKKFLDVGLQTASGVPCSAMRARLQDLPHRLVWPGEMAQRRSHRGAPGVPRSTRSQPLDALEWAGWSCSLRMPDSDRVEHPPGLWKPGACSAAPCQAPGAGAAAGGHGRFVATSLVERDLLLNCIKAMAEAAMVGALADWFAVVALFRQAAGAAHTAHGGDCPQPGAHRAQPGHLCARQVPRRALAGGADPQARPG